MKGYFPIEIPTKKYIKAYIHHQMGEEPVFNLNTRFGNKLYDLLSSENEKRTSFSRYNDTIRVYVSHNTFFRRGIYLNETNIKNFNKFVEEEIKSTYRMLMDFLMDIVPTFEGNLPEVRRRIGIDMEAWDTESIKKDYYRYRLRTGKPLLYKTNRELEVNYKNL